jgi:hypothetical protein
MLEFGELDGGTLSPGGLQNEGGQAVQELEEAREQCAVLREENEALRAQVAELETALAGVSARFELERSLTELGVLDMETALAVAEPRVRGGETPAVVARDLSRSKPFLFRRGGVPGGGSLGGGSLGGISASGVSGGVPASLESLAEEARLSGDRRALTRYLRRRRAE